MRYRMSDRSPETNVNYIELCKVTMQSLDEVDAGRIKTRTFIINKLADAIIENGGYCDEESFATVFFGGAADKYPDSFNKARKLGSMATFNCLEPFVDMDSSSFNHDEHLGIVMPGSKEFESLVVGYKIGKKQSSKSEAPILTGDILFKRYSVSEDYGLLDDHLLFGAIRSINSHEPKYSIYENIRFGIGEARRYMLPHGSSPSQSDIAKIDERVNALREDAKQYLNSNK